jgi:hypothetical protein
LRSSCGTDVEVELVGGKLFDRYTQTTIIGFSIQYQMEQQAYAMKDVLAAVP